MKSVIRTVLDEKVNVQVKLSAQIYEMSLVLVIDNKALVHVTKVEVD